MLIREQGDGALAVARIRANKCWDAGDDEGSATWLRIASAIEDLQQNKPPEGQKLQ